MCHNHDYHPCEGDKMEKELPKLPRIMPLYPEEHKMASALLAHINEMITAHNETVRYLASVEERAPDSAARLGTLEKNAADHEFRIRALTERMGKLERAEMEHIDKRRAEIEAAAPAPPKCAACGKTLSSYSEYDDTAKHYCNAACYEDYVSKKTEAPPTEGEVVWIRVMQDKLGAAYNLISGHIVNNQIRNVDPADLLTPQEVFGYKDECQNDIKEVLERAEAAEQRLKDAVEEAGEWFNKENGYLLGVMAEQEFNDWLARYGDNGGEK